MKWNYFTVTTIVLLAFSIFQAIRLPLMGKPYNWKTGFYFIASALLIVGSIGFFGSALAAWGGLSWLPSTFEWPISSAGNVLVLSDSIYIVPHIDTGRIQVYNSKLEFQRGWFVDAHGGFFKLVPAEGNSFFVFTARGGNKYQYDVQGLLLSSERYNDYEYSKITNAGIRINMPTPFYLLVFTNSFIAWLFCAMGIFLIYIVKKIEIC